MQIDLTPEHHDRLASLAEASGYTSVEAYAAARLRALADAEETKTKLDPEIGTAWGKEVERRILEAQNREVTMIPARDAAPGPRDA